MQAFTSTKSGINTIKSILTRNVYYSTSLKFQVSKFSGSPFSYNFNLPPINSKIRHVSTQSPKPQPPKQPNNNSQSKKVPPLGTSPFLGQLIFVLISAGIYVYQSNQKDFISVQEFNELLSNNQVSDISIINREYARVKTTSNQTIYVSFSTVKNFELNVHNTILKTQCRSVPIKYQSEVQMQVIAQQLLPSILVIGGVVYLLNQGVKAGQNSQMFNFGKSQAKKFNMESQINTRFDQVKGVDEAKKEIIEFVEFLKNPRKFEKLGAQIPRGAILFGPPGTGKTMLAKATAGEAGVPFYSISGSEFVEMFVGVGASRVRDLFNEARKTAPSIVFIDEIDAIGRKRAGNKQLGSGNDEREATLNQILVEMDGFETDDKVVVFAGTNRLETLDKALLRPGRFSRKIELSLPDIRGREAVLTEYLASIKLAPSETVANLAKKLSGLTANFSGADLKQVVNEAALQAVRMNDESVKFNHFELAIERQSFGILNKSKLQDLIDKKRVAFIESARTVLTYILTSQLPLKITTITRGRNLGYTHFKPLDLILMNNLELETIIKTVLAGRVIEEMKFSTLSSRTAADVQRAAFLARKMVCEYGMSNLGLLDATKLRSNYSKQRIENEIKELINACLEESKRLVNENLLVIERLAECLESRETLETSEIEKLIRSSACDH